MKKVFNNLLDILKDVAIIIILAISVLKLLSINIFVHNSFVNEVFNFVPLFVVAICLAKTLIHLKHKIK